MLCALMVSVVTRNSNGTNHDGPLPQLVLRRSVHHVKVVRGGGSERLRLTCSSVAQGHKGDRDEESGKG
eukprot:1667125-Rhodomonas_salina.1